jgi:hypothetical protein
MFLEGAIATQRRFKSGERNQLYLLLCAALRRKYPQKALSLPRFEPSRARQFGNGRRAKLYRAGGSWSEPTSTCLTASAIRAVGKPDAR